MYTYNYDCKYTTICLHIIILFSNNHIFAPSEVVTSITIKIVTIREQFGKPFNSGQQKSTGFFLKVIKKTFLQLIYEDH